MKHLNTTIIVQSLKLWIYFFPQSNYFLLGLKDGYLQLKYDFNFAGGPIVMDSKLPKLQINDARNHEVKHQQLTFLSFQQYYSSVTERDALSKNITWISFLRCL